MKHSLPFEDLKDIYRAIEKVPLVEMTYSIVKTNSQEDILTGEPLEEGREAMVLVNLKRTNRSNKQYVSISNFPKPKECCWFLIVGNPEKNELLAMKRVAFKRYASKNITICLPQDFVDDKLEITLMCDSYIGMDQCYTVDLMQINGAIKGQLDEQMEAGDDNDYMNYSMMDSEVESVMQPQNMETPVFDEQSLEGTAIGKEKKEGVYQSLFLNGFTAFDQFQRDMVDDILSDDEDFRTKAQRKKEKEEQL